MILYLIYLLIAGKKLVQVILNSQLIVKAYTGLCTQAQVLLNLMEVTPQYVKKVLFPKTHLSSMWRIMFLISEAGVRDSLQVGWKIC